MRPLVSSVCVRGGQFENFPEYNVFTNLIEYLKMKLLFCKECRDVFSLSDVVKTCTCGKTTGRYLDIMNAEYHGPCLPLGFANSTFLAAVRNQPEKDWGRDFTAFVIQKECATMVRKDKPIEGPPPVAVPIVQVDESVEEVIKKVTECL